MKEATNRFLTLEGPRRGAMLLYGHVPRASFAASVVVTTLPPLWCETLVRVRSSMYNVYKWYIYTATLLHLPWQTTRQPSVSENYLFRGNMFLL